MIPYLLGTMAFVLIVLSFVKKKSKWIPALLMFLGGLLIVGGTQSADMQNLWNRFVAGNYSSMPIGFTLLFGGIKKLGFSFFGFKALYVIAVLVPLYKLYKKYVGQMAVAVALFILFPFPDFTGQIRNGFAATMAMIALMWYITSNKKHSWIGYTVAILLCGSVHPATLVYLVGLLAKRNFKTRHLVIASLVATVAVYVALESGLLYKVVSKLTSSQRITQWFVAGETSGNNLKIYLVVTLGQLVSTLTLLYARNKIAAQQRRLEPVDAQGRPERFVRLTAEQVNAIARVNALLLLILPFYLLSPTYFRMYKYILILNYIVFCQAVFSQKKTDRLLLAWVTALVVFANLMSKKAASSEISFGFLESFRFSNVFHLFS